MRATALPSCLALLAALLLSLDPSASAQEVPRLINHEGMLVDAQGLPVTGQTIIALAIYDQPEGGVPLWREQYQLNLVDGYYSVRLGGVDPFGDLFAAGGERWLGIAVGVDLELTPRQRVVSVPMALVADNAIGDITPRTVTVGGRLVIDADGNWAGLPPGGGGGDGYETPEELLVALRTVDGPDSDLNADLLDGHDSSHFVSGADQVLALIRTVDGPNSGLNADRLDDIDSTQLMRHDDPGTPAAVLAMITTVDGAHSGLDADTLDGADGAAFFRPAAPDAAATAMGLVQSADGAGSGLDSDRLDDLDSTQFMRSDQDTGTTGALTVGGGLQVTGDVVAAAALQAGGDAVVVGALQAHGGAAVTGTLAGQEVRVAAGHRVGVGVDDPQAEVHVAGTVLADNLRADVCQAGSFVLQSRVGPPDNPVPGTIYYDANEGLRIYDGVEWGDVGGGEGNGNNGGGIPRSCQQILDSGASRGDGIYTVDPDGGDADNAFNVYCDMTTAGGGWTLVVLSNRDVAACPRPSWSEAVNDANYNGGALSEDLTTFDLFLGAKHWPALGDKLRIETGSGPASLAHQAFYDVFVNPGNNYSISLANEQVTVHTVGAPSPGLYSYHNNRQLSTRDADHDVHGDHCARSYCDAPWWYGECWSGSFWGGCGCNHTDDPYWSGSDPGGPDHFPWGAIWLRGDFSVPETRRSCWEILQNGESRGDGVYNVDPDGDGGAVGFPVYCDMTTDGGGWTLVLLSNGGVGGCPQPAWNQAVNGVTYNGANIGVDLTRFDLFLGVRYWRYFGGTLRVETGERPDALSHRAYYDYFLDDMDNYRLGLLNERVEIHRVGVESPGLFQYHANRPLTTHDADHDSHGGVNCSQSYCSAPWWYGDCWSGSFWGGCGCNHTDDAYWSGSDPGGPDHFPWGAFWVRGPAAGGALRASCKEILDEGRSGGDGVYLIDPNGGAPDDAVRTYCDMSTDGGGWTLVASNYSGDHTFPAGGGRVGYYLDRDGFNGNPSMRSDYLIGPQMASLTFSEARVYGEHGDDLNIIDLKWPQDCHRCFQQNNGVGQGVTFIGRHSADNIGCGSANHCNVDGQYADTFDGAWNSNVNQRTIGGTCTRTCPDPSCGTYVGHGSNEGGTFGEGNYYNRGGCSHQDDTIYTTWVR